jgi:hypothetical protein
MLARGWLCSVFDVTNPRRHRARNSARIRDELATTASENAWQIINVQQIKTRRPPK